MTELIALDAPAGGQIGYRTVGADGDWLVLIHGWCGSADHWDLVAPELSKAHRLLVVSHPGFGGMAAPAHKARTINAMGLAVVKVLAHLDIREATLIGHSMGGPIAVEAAIASPERVGGLLGLDTLSDRGYYGRVPNEEIARRRWHFASDYRANMRMMVDAIVDPTTNEDMRAQLTHGMLAAAPADVALDINEDLFAWNAEERWPLVGCPKMLLNSPHVARLADPQPMPCFAATEIATYGSGHFPMIEAPGMIVEKIENCLAHLASARNSTH
jgi:pimeloyl-ACP methyl ester carboxylesterase